MESVGKIFEYNIKDVLCRGEREGEREEGIEEERERDRDWDFFFFWIKGIFLDCFEFVLGLC